MLYQISRAVQVCHSRLRDCTIFHRDIKPSNVFLDCHGNAKLGDFGLARIVTTENDFSKTFVGTPYYMSPVCINFILIIDCENKNLVRNTCVIFAFCNSHSFKFGTFINVR